MVVANPFAASPAVAATSRQQFAYVANSGASTVSVIDTLTNKVVGDLIPVGIGSIAVAITKFAADEDPPPGPGPGPGLGPGLGPGNPRPAPVDPGVLPITGSPGLTLLAIALTMIGAGGALLLASRRSIRRRRPTS
ncbi:MAG: hypothetical protein JWP76_2707 [Dactylosporangium sp.]|nr:hypothetical protein [Dactylosporangium sp.]